MDKNQSAEPAARRGWGQTQSLLTVVFVCGAVLMAFEMVGFRILAPTFGTTTFAVGSVISVFLGALSLGYLLGGRLSDKHPSFFLLGTIIAVSGVIVLVVPLYAPAGCLWISSMNPEGKANPLFASILLFLAPSVLLGMVSPFAVRLQAKSVSTVGNVAGKLYALSTLGSIAGTLLATFWLIPSFGGSAIAASLGLVLIAVSLLALLPGARDRLGHGKAGAAIATTLLVALGMGLWFIPHPSFIPLREGEVLVEEVDSPYQHIGVVLIPKNRRDDGTQKKEDVKWAVRLQFDQYIESEVDVESGDPENVRVSEPYTSNAKYTDMLHLPLLFNSAPKNVLIVGGGGGVVPTLYRRDYPNVHIDVCEIDPIVRDIAEKYFDFVANDERTTTTIMDGRVFLQHNTKKYDIIILDAFTGGRPPFHLLTVEFLTLVKQRLTDKGVAHMNIISALDGEMSRLYCSMHKTFAEVFGRDRVYVFPKLYDPRYGHHNDRTRGMNVELVATNFDTKPSSPLAKSAIELRARRLAQSRRIRIASIPIHASNHLPEERDRDFSDAPLITDDYAPVDNWVTD